MKDMKNLTESEIKQALKEGYITKQEARQMLMVYLQRADFTPMQHPGIHNTKRSFVRRY